jgi:hypothetical protein
MSAGFDTACERQQLGMTRSGFILSSGRHKSSLLVVFNIASSSASAGSKILNCSKRTLYILTAPLL